MNGFHAVGFAADEPRDLWQLSHGWPTLPLCTSPVCAASEQTITRIDSGSWNSWNSPRGRYGT